MCFASTTPLYCYDRFGGPGYLEPEEFEEAKRTNYSGRSNPKKLSAEELVEDLIRGYPDALGRLTLFREKAELEFSAGGYYKQLLQEVERARPVTTCGEMNDTDKVRCRILFAALRES